MANRTAKNFKQLRDILAYNISEALKDSLKNDIVPKGKEIIQSNVYDVYNPSEYNRTYKLRDSLTFDVDSDKQNFIAEIYHDTNILKEGNYRLGYTGEDVSEQIPYWVNTTGTPNVFNLPYDDKYKFLSPRNYINDIEEYTRKNLANIMIKNIKSKGIKAKK